MRNALSWLLHKHASFSSSLLTNIHMKCAISSWLWHEAIFARMGWSPSLDGVQSFTMLPSSFISGSCQPLQFPLYLEATYTFVSIGLTYTTMKPSPHLGLLITRHSRDFASNIMVILKFSPLQLIRWEINPYRWNYI